MYTLFHKKEENIIKVSKAKKALQDIEFPEKITYRNNNYFICKTRKPLVDLAREMKEQWILEAEEKLKAIQQIKI